VSIAAKQTYKQYAISPFGRNDSVEQQKKLCDLKSRMKTLCPLWLKKILQQ